MLQTQADDSIKHDLQTHNTLAPQLVRLNKMQGTACRLPAQPLNSSR